MKDRARNEDFVVVRNVSVSLKGNGKRHNSRRFLFLAATIHHATMIDGLADRKQPKEVTISSWP